MPAAQVSERTKAIAEITMPAMSADAVQFQRALIKKEGAMTAGLVVGNFRSSPLVSEILRSRFFQSDISLGAVSFRWIGSWRNYRG
jgi:hypothetical protein